MSEKMNRGLTPEEVNRLHTEICNVLLKEESVKYGETDASYFYCQGRISGLTFAKNLIESLCI